MIYQRNLEWSNTQWKYWIRRPTQLLTSKWHPTLYTCTSIDRSCILNAGDVGDVVVVAVAARDGLAAAGDGRPAHWQNSWESHASICSSNKAAETIERIVRLLYQLLKDVIKEDLIKAALIGVRLCHRWVHTIGVDLLANHPAVTVKHFGLNLWRKRTIIHVETTNYICACIINCIIDVSCIAPTLWSTSWTKPRLHPKCACFPGRQTMVDGSHCEGNECRVDLINQWFIIHYHLSYAIEVCLVNNIHSFSFCKAKLALLNRLSRQRYDKLGTLNLCHECM